MKLVLFNICFLFLGFYANAQISISYSLGSIGGNMKTSTYSSPILINGENCIKVTNSISKFSTSKKGDFYTNCAVNLDFSKTQIQLALSPNPVNSYTVLKCTGKLPNDSKFSILVYNNSGQPVYATETTQPLLLSGFRLELSSLITGVYFVQVSSSSVLTTIKFLKN